MHTTCIRIPAPVVVTSCDIITVRLEKMPSYLSNFVRCPNRHDLIRRLINEGAIAGSCLLGALDHDVSQDGANRQHKHQDDQESNRELHEAAHGILALLVELSGTRKLGRLDASVSRGVERLKQLPNLP